MAEKPTNRRRRYPRITAGQDRTVKVEALVSPVERAVIAEAADAAGLPVAAYVRARALSQPVTHRGLLHGLGRLTAEAARIGNNLNQLTRWANVSGGNLPEREILNGIRADLKSAIAELRDEIAIERPRRRQ